MRNKAPVILLFIILLGITLLYSLYYFTEKPNTKRNGFNRQFFENPVKFIVKHKQPSALNRLAGINKDKIYFISKNVNILTIADWNLETFDTLTYSRPLNINVTAVHHVEADSPKIMLFAGNLSALFTYTWHDTLVQGTKFKTPLFTRSTQISSRTVVLRAFDSLRRKQVFKIADANIGSIRTEADIIKNQEDGGFATDGWLLFDSTSFRILYVSIFENKFYCMDTTLNVLYISKTIDTVNHNPVRTHLFATNDKEGSLKPSEPLKLVNRDACISDGNLYVVSALRSDNENENSFYTNSVVDVYQIATGKYKASFYIPDIQKEKLRYLRVMDNRIIALYKNYVAVYKLSLEAIK